MKHKYIFIASIIIIMIFIGAFVSREGIDKRIPLYTNIGEIDVDPDKLTIFIVDEDELIQCEDRDEFINFIWEATYYSTKEGEVEEKVEVKLPKDLTINYIKI